MEREKREKEREGEREGGSPICCFIPQRLLTAEIRLVFGCKGKPNAVLSFE